MKPSSFPDLICYSLAYLWLQKANSLNLTSVKESNQRNVEMKWSIC